MNRFIIGLFITAGLLIVLILIIIQSGGKSTPSGRTLSSYASTSAQARLTIDGPINAQLNHNEVEITVDNTDATIDVVQGYEGTVINSESYVNNQAAYSAFLSALNLAGFTKGNTAADLKSAAGYCSTGDRYIFELMQNGSDIERFWTTGCSGTPHSFDGNLDLNLTLFEQQIPNYGDVTAGLDI